MLALDNSVMGLSRLLQPMTCERQRPQCTFPVVDWLIEFVRVEGIAINTEYRRNTFNVGGSFWLKSVH